VTRAQIPVARRAIGRSEVQRRDERELRWYFGGGPALTSASSRRVQQRARGRAHRIEPTLERLEQSVVRLLAAAYGHAAETPVRTGRLFGITAGAASASPTVTALGGVEAYAALGNQARSVAATRGGTALRAMAFVTVRSAVEDEVRRALIAYRHAANVVHAIEVRARERGRTRRTGRLVDVEDRRRS